MPTSRPVGAFCATVGVVKKGSLELLGRVQQAAVDVALRDLGQHMDATRQAAGALTEELDRLQGERQGRIDVVEAERERALRDSIPVGDLQRLGEYCDESRRRERGLAERTERARERLDSAHHAELSAAERLKDRKVEQTQGQRLLEIEAAKQRKREEQRNEEEALEAWSSRRR